MTYNPAIGRFLERDPIVYGDGMDFYEYVGGRPIVATDPMGTESRTTCAVEKIFIVVQKVLEFKVNQNGRTIRITILIDPQMVSSVDGKYVSKRPLEPKDADYARYKKDGFKMVVSHTLPPNMKPEDYVK